MTVAELSRIDKTIEIKAAPDRVWRALTSARELSAWLQVSIEGDIAPGAEVWMTSTHSTVTFTLEPSGSGTRLSVSETGFDAISLTRRAKVHGDNSQGWAEVLVWLQTYVEKAR